MNSDYNAYICICVLFPYTPSVYTLAKIRQDNVEILKHDAKFVSKQLYMYTFNTILEDGYKSSFLYIGASNGFGTKHSLELENLYVTE